MSPGTAGFFGIPSPPKIFMSRVFLLNSPSCETGPTWFAVVTLPTAPVCCRYFNKVCTASEITFAISRFLAQRCPVCVNVIAGVADLPLRRAAAPGRAEQLDRRIVGCLGGERSAPHLGVPDGFLARRPVEEESCSLFVSTLGELPGLVRESGCQHALLQHVLVDERRQGRCERQLLRLLPVGVADQFDGIWSRIELDQLAAGFGIDACLS